MSRRAKIEELDDFSFKIIVNDLSPCALASLAFSHYNNKKSCFLVFLLFCTHREQHGIDVQREFDTVIEVDAFLPFFIRRHDDFLRLFSGTRSFKLKNKGL